MLMGKAHVLAGGQNRRKMALFLTSYVSQMGYHFLFPPKEAKDWALKGPQRAPMGSKRQQITNIRDCSCVFRVCSVIEWKNSPLEVALCMLGGVR